MNDKRDREPLQWKEDVVFVDDRSSLAIRVNKAIGGSRTMFSLEIGRVHLERFMRFFNPRIDSVGTFEVNVTFFDFASLQALVEKARLHCKTVIEEERIERKRQKEEADVARGKPQMKPGLKQLSKQDAVAKELVAQLKK
jgi:hypothetical protein